MRARRTAVWIGIGLAVVLVLLLAAVLILTRTDRGRERVRNYALDRLEHAIEGEIEIGRIEGDLLRRVRLIDVAIRDRQGRPFLEADTFATRFGLRALLRQRIQLADVRAVNAVVTLDQPPGEEWNYVRIFRIDPDTLEAGPPGWGDWVELDDVTLVNSRLTVRAEWRPPEGATPGERQAALREALAGDTREHVVEVPGGYQNVMQYRELDAEVPRALIAHPDTAGMSFQVARLGGLVRPFSPPPARVHDLSGEVRLRRDSLFLSGVRAVLPGSRLDGGAVYALHSGELLLIARGAPVAFEDLHWIEPRLPDRGGGEMVLRLELGPVVDRIVAMDMDVAIGDAVVRGRFDLTTGETVRFGETDLRFARVETGLVERLFGVDLPRPGRLSGELALAGPPRALSVDGDIRFDDRAGPSSRVIAEGGLGVDPALRFQELRLRFAPLQAQLARVAVPELPLRGTIEGTAILTGTLELLDLDADLALRDPRHGLSRVRLAGGLDRREELRLRDLTVRMDPLRLDLLRDELPELPAGATATGRVTLDGVPARALSLDGDIILDDPATGVSGIGATGELVLADEIRFRELRLRFSPLQAELARIVIPELPLRGSIEGTALLTGSPTVLDLEADLVLRDPRHGRSRVIAAGGLDRRGELRLVDMDLRLDPLRLDLLRGELPELPPDAAVTGRVRLDGMPSRALSMEGDIIVDDPATGVSDIGARGRIAFGDELRFDDLRLRLEPLRVDLVRPWVPELPPGGTLAGEIQLDGAPSGFLYVDGGLAHQNERLGASRVQVSGGLDLAGPLEFRGFALSMDPLRVELVRAWVPELPPGGTLEGKLSLDGVATAFLYVDGRIAHHHPDLGTSRVQVSGGIALAGPVEFRDFDVRMDPLRMALVRPFAPELPLDGTLSGTARLDGSPDSRIAIRGDVVHEERGERSHVTGTVDVVAGPGGWASIDVRLQPLSLDVAGRFFPAAGLRGSVAGRLRTTGDMGDLRVDADLRVAGGGAIRAEGTLDLAAAAPAYDLDMRLRDFDLAAVTWRAPAETDLTGAITARGRGLDPATMRATIAADLSASGIDDVHADRVRLRAELDAGLARVDSSIIRLSGAEAVLDGSFGLVAGRDGVLSYRIGVDSLHAFAPWLPGADTAVAPPVGPVPPAPKPAVLAETRDGDAGDPDPRDAHAAAAPDPAEPALAAVDGGVARRYIAPDGARVTVNTTRVQSGMERVDRDPRVMLEAAVRDAAGADTLRAPGAGREPAAEPEPPPLRAPADSLAGSLYAAGSLRGNVERFDLNGRAVIDDLLYRGAYIGGGEAEYALADVGTSSPDITLDAELRDVRTATVAFDSLSARGRYHGIRGEGEGEARIIAHGTDDTEYLVDADFALSLERSELRLADLVLRYDTVTWRTAQPGVVSWAGDAIDVARIDLVSDAGGRVRLDGRLPVDGSGDMDVLIEDLDIAAVVALLQLEQDVEGQLYLDAHVAGTLESPRIEGTARLDAARLEGEPVPDVRASFRYAGLELTADATLLEGGRQLATAEARLPIDLSLAPGVALRLLPGHLAVDVRADSLPIEAIPVLSAQVEDPRGRLRGELAVRGTFEDPVVTGEVDLDLASVRIVPLDIRLEEVAGALTLEGTVVRVDSLVAHSGGPLRVTGEIGLEALTNPTFALAIESRETLVIDTDDLALAVDADLTVGGTLAAIEVGGDVRTRRGVIRIPELTELGETEVVSLHAPATSGRIEEEFLEDELRLNRRRPLLGRLHVDIALQVDRDVWVRSTEANVEIYTPREVGPLRIRLDGPGSGLALEGTLSTDRGEYEFMSRRFDLTRGAATFIAEPEINPILQIAAEHEVRLPGREAFAIRVLLGGTLRDMEITLESTAQPPIAQTDLLSYLAFGRDATSLLFRQGSSLSAQAGEGGELVGNVAGLATQQLGTIALDAVLGDLERELMDDLGVDLFRITPADLPPDMFTGGYGDLLRSTEIEAGRYVSSRLFVAGQINTGISRPGVRVEYVGPFGVEWLTSWTSRWMPSEPTLTERDPRRAGILGSFLLREWRF